MNPQPAASLESRAQAYWGRRQARDLAGAYPFYCAAYRARVSQSQFLQFTRLVRFDFLEVHVAGAKVVNNRADVTIKYRFLVPTLPEPAVDGETTEVWALDPDGQWCKEDEPVLLPFPQTPSSQPSSAAAVRRATYNTKS